MAIQQEGNRMTSLTHTQVAEAFCRHRFAETYASLGDDVEWRLVGASPIRGKTAVIAACDESAAELANLSTSFARFRVIEAADCAIVRVRLSIKRARRRRAWPHATSSTSVATE
jgi:hypothetical protein